MDGQIAKQPPRMTSSIGRCLGCGKACHLCARRQKQRAAVMKRRWAKIKAEKLCMYCGKVRPPELKWRCRACQDKQNKYQIDYLRLGPMKERP